MTVAYMQSGISSGQAGGVSSSTQMRRLGHFLSWQAVLFPQRAVMSLFLRPRTKVALHSPWQESTTHLAVGYLGHLSTKIAEHFSSLEHVSICVKWKE